MQTYLKLGQIAGALLMAAGVTGCIVNTRDVAWMGYWWGGIALYAICRLWAWLAAKK